MANKTFATYLSELSAVTSLGAGDKLPVLESSTVKYVDGGDIGGTSYLKYVALLSQTGTNAPTAIVLENTLGGTVVWTRADAGEYTGTLSSVFTENKTFILVGMNGGALISLSAYPDTDSAIQVETRDSGSLADDILFLAPIEIRVYP